MLIDELNTQRLADGDNDQWRQMVDGYSPLLHRHARQITRNRHDADEVVQCTLFRLWVGRTAFALVQRLEPFLVSCVRNNAKNHLRSRARKLQLRGDTLGLASTFVAGEESPLEQLERQELANQVQRMSEKLTPPQQRVFEVLRQDSDLSSRAVAAQLGCSHKNVQALLQRVRTVAMPL